MNPALLETVHDDTGSGFPLVLVHGLGLDRAMWAAQASALGRNYRVIAYDILGHGESAKPAGPYRLDMFTDQLAALTDGLGLDRFALAGFSLGGLIALAFALTRPGRVAALVVVSAVCERNDEERAAVSARAELTAREGPTATVEAALSRWFGAGFAARNEEVLAAIARRIEGNEPHAYAAAYRLFADADRELAGRLAGIGCPTLVVTGAEDLGSTPAMAHRMAGLIPGARAEIVDGARHMLPIEGAEALNGLLEAFIAKATADPA